MEIREFVKDSTTAETQFEQCFVGDSAESEALSVDLFPSIQK